MQKTTALSTAGAEYYSAVSALSRVTSALKGNVSQAHRKPRPEQDIDLNLDYPSPGNPEACLLVDGFGPTKDCAVES